MNLNVETMNVETSNRPRRPAQRDRAADVHAFADRLLYAGWLEDSRRDAIKLQMIRAIVEWANAGARN